MESKNKIYIISGIFVAAVLVMCVCSIFLINEIIKKSKELVLGEERVIILEKEFNDVEAFKEKYNDYKINLEKIDTLFIDSRNPVSFIEFLEGISSDYKLDLKVSVPVFSSSPVVAGDFQVSLFGSFSDILGFINKIENGPYLIQIKDLNIAKSQDGPVAESSSKDKLAGQLKVTISMQVLAK